MGFGVRQKCLQILTPLRAVAVQPEGKSESLEDTFPPAMWEWECLAQRIALWNKVWNVYV